MAKDVSTRRFSEKLGTEICAGIPVLGEAVVQSSSVRRRMVSPSALRVPRAQPQHLLLLLVKIGSSRAGSLDEASTPDSCKSGNGGGTRQVSTRFPPGSAP